MAISDAEFTAWLADTSAKRVLLAEVNVWDTSAGAEVTRYLASRDYYNGATHYEGRIKGVPVLSSSIPINGGPVETALGGLQLANDDDYFTDSANDWIADGWDGRSITLKYGDPAWEYSDFRTIFVGVVEDFVIDDEDGPEILIRDRGYLLDVPIRGRLIDRGPNAGASKPIAIGSCSNVEAVQWDDTGKIWVVHDGECKDVAKVVYEDSAVTGKTVTKDQPFPGAFTLSAAATGVVTVDVEGAQVEGDYKDTFGKAIRWLLGEFSPLVDSDDLDTAAFTQMDLDCPYEQGIYIKEERQLKEVIAELIGEEGAFGFYTWTNAGLFTLGQIKAPSGDAALALDDRVSIDSITLRSATDQIHHTTKLGYDKNWTQQAAGLSSSATAEREAFVRRGRQDDRAVARQDDIWRRLTPADEHANVAIARNAAISLLHAGAVEPATVPTLIAIEEDASTEAARRLPILGSARRRYRLEVDGASLFEVDLGSVVSLTDERLNLESGKDFRLVAIEKNLLDGTAIVELMPGNDTFPEADCVVEYAAFTAPTSGPTVDITTSALGGVTPKAVLLVLNGNTAWDGNEDSDSKLCFGAADAGAQWVTTYVDQDAVGTSNCNELSTTTQCLLLLNDAGSAVEGECSFNSFIADGVRLDVDTAFPSAYTGVAIFFAGEDLEADVGKVDCPANAAGVTVDNSFAGSPDLVFFASNDNPFDDTIRAGIQHSVAAISRHVSAPRCRGSAHNADDGQATTDADGLYFAEVFGLVGSQVTTYRFQPTFTDSGFRLYNYTSYDASTKDVGYLSLRMPGVNVWVSDFDQPQSTGAYALRPGFAPQAFLNFTSYMDELLVEEPTAGGTFGFGVATQAGNNAMLTRSEDGVGTSNTGNRSDELAVFAKDHDDTDLIAATRTNDLVNGIELTYTDAASTSVIGWYIAIGNVAIAIAGSTVFGLDNDVTPTSTGTKDFTDSSLGDDAVCGIYIGTLATSFGATVDDAGIFFGASDGAVQFVIAVSAEDNLATSDTEAYYSNAAAIAVDANASLQALADHDSFISNGQRMDFTTAASARALSAMLFAGASVKIGTVDVTSVALDVAETVSGIGFTPAAVIIFPLQAYSVGANDGDAPFSLGWSDGTNQGCLMTRSRDAQATTRGLALLSNTYAGRWQATGTYLDVDNFQSGSFDITQRGNSAAAEVVGYIALGGIDAVVMNKTVTAGTGNESYTGAGFQGTGMIIGGILGSTFDSSESGNAADGFSLGMAVDNSGITQACHETCDGDNLATSNAQSQSHNDCVCAVTQESGGGNFSTRKRALVSFDADGYTLNRLDSDEHITTALVFKAAA